MKDVVTIGTPPWTRSEMLDSIEEFSRLYADRPIKDNRGGMRAPHMFAVWFMTKKLSPDLIVESGVWKGQGTWLLEAACPGARLVSIDLNLSRRQYVSDQAIYSDRDFSEQDWSEVTDRSLAFFDDHQNAYERVQQCRWFGFRHMIFEDNYPVSQGDCYSLKKAFASAGFEPSWERSSGGVRNTVASILDKLRNTFGLGPRYQFEPSGVRPNNVDARMLHKHLDVYYEFPPVVKEIKTRWGDEWEEARYPTPEPLMDPSLRQPPRVFMEEAIYYTWICYAKLK